MGTVSSDGTQNYGDWSNVQNRYLGILFTDSSSVDHYGWVELSFSQSTGVATIEGWAYNTIPPSSPAGFINAGAVPEPSTLALSVLALGSLGVAALHRSRKPVQDPPVN